MKGFIFYRYKAVDGLVEDIYCDEVHLRHIKSRPTSFLTGAEYYICLGKCYDTDGNCNEEVELPEVVRSLVEDGRGAKCGAVII